MALQKTFEVPDTGGYTIPDAYICINETVTKKENQSILLFFYLNKDAKDSGKDPLYKCMYPFIPDLSDAGKNAYKQGYEYLKTLTEFEGTIDILEEGQQV